MYRRGLPPPPADTPNSDRGTNGVSHDAVGAAMADMSLDGRCLSLPDRLSRPSHPGTPVHLSTQHHHYHHQTEYLEWPK